MFRLGNEIFRSCACNFFPYQI